MTLLLILCVYAAVVVAAARPLAGHFAWHFHLVDVDKYPSLYKTRTGPNGDQWFGGFCLALVIGLVWPLALCFYAAGRIGPTVGAEREAQLRVAQERIEKLERELEVVR